MKTIALVILAMVLAGCAAQSHSAREVYLTCYVDTSKTSEYLSRRQVDEYCLSKVKEWEAKDKTPPWYLSEWFWGRVPPPGYSSGFNCISSGNSMHCS
jgi:hypothetical protein